MEKIEDVEKFIRETLAKRNINLDNYNFDEKESRCKTCGEVISLFNI